MPRRFGVGAGRQLAQPLRWRADNNLTKRQQDYRYDKRSDIIQNAEQQHPGEPFLAVHLPEPDQYRGIENAEPARGMAGKSQQRGRNKNYRYDHKAQIG